MAKPIKSVTLYPGNQENLEKCLRSLSAEFGGAWVFWLPAFATPTDPCEFICYKSPSRVPDSFMNRYELMGYKGELVPFTRGARIREQNRGLCKD